MNLNLKKIFTADLNKICFERSEIRCYAVYLFEILFFLKLMKYAGIALSILTATHDMNVSTDFIKNN